ncbi:hypothetical protein V2J09_005804 [Rumex salicifolius]
MNARKLVSTYLFAFISTLRRFISILTKTTRFPLLVKTGDLLLALYFRYCGLSPSTFDVDESTTVHVWSSAHRRHSKPNLILLHGFGGDSRWQFYSQIRSLSADYNLFVPDLLFFGKSFTRRADRTVENQARSVMEALRRGFGVGRCSLYAISYGGWVGYWMAEMYPDEVEKVVIVSSGVGFSEEQRKVHLNKLGRRIEDLLIPEGPADLRALFDVVTHKCRLKWVPDFFLQQFVQASLLFTVTHENYKQERRELVHHLLNQKPDSNYLPPITQETLLIWGDQDKIFPPYMAYQLQRRLGPKASVLIIKDCGHAVNLDAPHQANELVKAFMLH